MTTNNQLPKDCQQLTGQLINDYLKPRQKDSHKGSYGHVLLIGGNRGSTGAILLAAEAALRSGAGLATVATHPEHASTLNLSRPEVMCHAAEHPGDLAPLLERATVIAIGPGLGQDEWGRNLWQLIQSQSLPKVIDADALSLLAQQPLKNDQWVLTPHPGEAARLFATTTNEIQADRFAAAKQIQSQYGGVCVLKGAGTIVVDANAQSFVCVAGNPGMATAGMGDVLTGIIASFIAQGLTHSQAAQAGVYIHATAGDLVAKANGERGMMARDLMPHIRKLANGL